jgi:hypothetical protein
MFFCGLEFIYYRCGAAVGKNSTQEISEEKRVLLLKTESIVKNI